MMNRFSLQSRVILYVLLISGSVLSAGCWANKGQVVNPSEPFPKPFNRQKFLEFANEVLSSQQPPYVKDLLPAWLAEQIRRNTPSGLTPQQLASLAGQNGAYFNQDEVPFGSHVKPAKDDRRNVNRDLLNATQLLQGSLGAIQAEMAAELGVSNPELNRIRANFYHLIGRMGSIWWAPNLWEYAVQEGWAGKNDEAKYYESIETLQKVGRVWVVGMFVKILKDEAPASFVPKVLEQAADVYDFEGAYVNARRIRETRFSFLASPTQVDWYKLAESCFRDYDATSGEIALRRGDALATSEDAQAVRMEVEAIAPLVRELETLKTSDTLESGLRQGLLLAKLGRHTDAQQVYRALIEKYPDDARPRAGLAAAFPPNAFSAEAVTLIEEALPLANKDRAFYEIAINTYLLAGLTNGEYNQAATWGVVVKIRDLAAKYERYNAALGYLIKNISAEIVTFAQVNEEDRGKAVFRLLERVWKIAKTARNKHPDSVQAYEVAAALIHFAANVDEGLEILADPPKTILSDRRAMLLRARAFLILAALGGRPDLLPTVAEAIEQVPSGNEGEADYFAMRGDFELMQGLWLFRAANFRSAHRDYMNAVASKPDEPLRNALANNAAFLSLQFGQQNDAVENWRVAADSFKPAKWSIDLIEMPDLRPTCFWRHELEHADLIDRRFCALWLASYGKAYGSERDQRDAEAELRKVFLDWGGSGLLLPVDPHFTLHSNTNFYSEFDYENGLRIYFNRQGELFFLNVPSDWKELIPAQ